VFRIGSVSASVFVNDVNGDGPPRQVRNVSLQCSYRDGGERKFSSYFGLADFLVAKQVLQLLEVQDTNDGLLVLTERGMIRTRHVVNCTESYTPLLHRQFSGIMRPTQTQAATGENGPAAMKPHVGISSSHTFFGHHGKSVMVGTDATRVPDLQAGRVQPSRFLTKFCIAEIKRRFGAFEYHVTDEWSGTVTYTPNEYPVVGLMDGNRQYIIGGMAGSETTVGFNAARCIVNRLLGCTDEPDDFPPEYFSPITHTWSALENGVADNPAFVAAEWWQRPNGDKKGPVSA